ncbi:unnamed protein product [Auanema sp. JU1783]|nr:unnamed protein product [Auanema sp. JU1783]
MADHKALPVFAFIEEPIQLRELRQYLNNVGAKLAEDGPQDVSSNLIEICAGLHVMNKCTNPPEVDFILSSVCSLIVSIPVERAAEVVSAFCKAVNPSVFKGTGWTSNAGFSVRVLSNIFRGFAAHATIQEEVYRSLVAMCSESRLIGELDCSVEALEKQFSRWNTSTEGKRDILRLVHLALLNDQRADQAAKIMIMLLGTYTETDAGSAAEDAAECVRTAVVDPKSFSFDHLQRLSAVKALKKSDPLMYSGLELFISGTLKDYKAFVKTNPDFVTKKLRVDEDVIMKKIRLLTLMTIAENNNAIGMNELGAQLDLSPDDALEEFIIEAIQVNAISGKINEMTRELVVSSSQHREFGRDQWVTLQKRLQGLIANLRQAHSNIKSVNQQIDEVAA